jgi:hypothetical protein
VVIFLITFGKMPGKESAGFYCESMFNFVSNCQIVFKVAVPFVFPPIINESSYCYTSWPGFGILSGLFVFLIMKWDVGILNTIIICHLHIFFWGCIY